MLQFLAFYNYGDKKPTDSDDITRIYKCAMQYLLSFQIQNTCNKGYLKNVSHCFHSGEDSCFTTMSTTVYAMGYEYKTALTSSDCASHCLMSSSCGAVYVTAGGTCSMLQYNTGLDSRLSASHLAYTHLYHRSRSFHWSD